MTTMMKLIARPGQVQTTGKCICFALTSEKVPALPAGMPSLSPGTKYLVVVAAKQWNKIAPDLEADPGGQGAHRRLPHAPAGVYWR